MYHRIEFGHSFVWIPRVIRQQLLPHRLSVAVAAAGTGAGRMALHGLRECQQKAGRKSNLGRGAAEGDDAERRVRPRRLGFGKPSVQAARTRGQLSSRSRS